MFSSCVLALMVAAAGVAWLATGQPAQAQSAAGLTVAVLANAPTVEEDKYGYVGSGKCKMCHMEAYKSWEETKHAKAFDLLKPDQAAEAKAKHNLDPKKDYTKDEACLDCHTVGFKHKDGFAIVEDPAKAEKIVKNLGAVGCENCHGPGSEYTEYHKQIKKDKSTYTWDQMAEKGMVKIDQDLCNKCHNDKSPTYEEGKAVKLDPEAREGIHAKTELKQLQK